MPLIINAQNVGDGAVSNIDNSPLATCERVPSKPRQDVASLLTILREAAQEASIEDPCLLMTAFFEHCPLPAWIKAVKDDGSLAMVHVNRAFTAATGIRAIDYMSQPDTEFFDVVSAANAEHEDMLCLIERVTLPINSFVAHPDDAERTLRFTGWKWPVMVDGKPVAVCGVAQATEVSFDGA